MLSEFLNTGVSICVGYAVAVWQNHRSDHRSDVSDAIIQTLPQSFIRALEEGHFTVSSIPKRLTNLEEDDWPSYVSFADVNNDGKVELLVQYLAGAHGNLLQVFGWKNREYMEIARYAVGVPVAFEFGDFDHDGEIEILGKESDWDTGLPYGLVPRYSFRLRWDGEKFVEVWRAKDYSDQELDALRSQSHRS